MIKHSLTWWTKDQPVLRELIACDLANHEAVTLTTHTNRAARAA